MVAQRLPQYMTLDEYHELVRKNPDARYEYLDGQVYLMALYQRTTVKESLL